MAEPLSPGATIGILGGGQLGRMLALSAACLGYKTHIFDPAKDAPAKQVSAAGTTAKFTSKAALKKFGQAVDVVTFEFENVPAEALDLLEGEVQFFPGRTALAVSQDRFVEKEFLNDAGIPTAPHLKVDTLDDLREAATRLGLPLVLKTRRLGYDGKGQFVLRRPDQVEEAFAVLGGAAGIAEGFIDFEREVSVIGTRAQDGTIVCFDPGENVHENGILKTTTVPAMINNRQRQDMLHFTEALLTELKYVGTIGVEFFVTADGIIANEFAPRVHNSGHWTEAACMIDQFEQHIRAVAGLPLGSGVRHSNAIMTNLLGVDITGAEAITDGAVQVYGKSETRAGRKMGHVTRLSPRT